MGGGLAAPRVPGGGLGQAGRHRPTQGRYHTPRLALLRPNALALGQLQEAGPGRHHMCPSLS